MLRDAGRSTVSGALCALGAMFFSCATSAGAATSPYDSLVITSTMENEYSYSFGNGPTQTFTPTDNDVRLRLNFSEGGYVSQLGIDFTTRLDGDSFYFLHNGYCVGSCSIGMSTKLALTLTNTGDTPVSLRWDSLITPGHLAQQGQGGSANYKFIIVEGGVDDGGEIYSTYGDTFGWYDFFSVLGGPGLTGFVRDAYSEGVGHLNAWSYANWGATSLNFDLLTIAPNTTHVLNYYSTISMAMSDNCTDLSECDGVQVAFGDPRNDGGISSRSISAFSSAEPLIGREFDVYTTEGKIDQMFVEQGSPLPDPLPSITIPSYSGPSFRTPTPAAAVPEPASWALLLLGFGIMGWSMRRTRRPASHLLMRRAAHAV